MKSAAQILPNFPEPRIVRQVWGQSPASVYVQVSKVWSTMEIDQKLVVVLSKKFGLKKLIEFLESHDLSLELVGKEGNDVRLYQIHKTTMRPLEKLAPKTPIKFELGGKVYSVDTGEAIFSKNDLDEGTRALLETFLAKKIDLSSKTIADLGAGWGAISLVLATEFPEASISAFELDDASVDAAESNLSGLPQVEVVKTDLSIRFVEEVESRRGCFDYILANPPFHVTEIDRNRIFVNAAKLLKHDGEMYFVSDGHFVERFKKVASVVFASTNEQRVGEWAIFHCTK